MKIGIIGDRAIGTAIAKHLTEAGYDVIISNSRGADTLTETIKKYVAISVSVSVQGSRRADVVFLPCDGSMPKGTIRCKLRGKILVDVTNAAFPICTCRARLKTSS